VFEDIVEGGVCASLCVEASEKSVTVVAFIMKAELPTGNVTPPGRVFFEPIPSDASWLCAAGAF
jgi:hypothetical protein